MLTRLPIASTTLMRFMTLLCLALACAVVSVHGTQARQSDLKTAEVVGRQLYEQSRHAASSSPSPLRHAKQVAAAALPQVDPSKYHFEVIKNPAGRGWLVYALAYSKDPDQVVFGIHYRITVAEDGSKVESVEPLSRSAVVVSKTKGIPKGAIPGPLWATSLVSPTPLEVYVYLSLLHNTPIFVGAPDRTIWKVDGTNISKVQNGT